MQIAILIPNTLIQGSDPHTGIPFMPHVAAYTAGALKDAGFAISIVDSAVTDSGFSINPLNQQFSIIGSLPKAVVRRIPQSSSIIYLYARTAEDYLSIEMLIKECKAKLPNIPLVVFENTQTVNSFSLKILARQIFDLGADFILLGEPEESAVQLAQHIEDQDNSYLKTIPGLLHSKMKAIEIENTASATINLNAKRLPLWTQEQLQAYWSIKFAHAPINKSTSQWAPILVSRGCPYRCTFCVSPAIAPKWRTRSASDIYAELEYLVRHFSINEVHVSDLTPTASMKMWRELQHMTKSNPLPIKMKFAQGTKLETIKTRQDLLTLKEIGLTYLSFSPESGSDELMTKLNKKFDYQHGLEMVSASRDLRISTQACFLIGTKHERITDHLKSLNYINKLSRRGLNEIAVFIYTPLPGSGLANDYELDLKNLSKLNRSPIWRSDYTRLNAIRFIYYTVFIFSFVIYFPIRLFTVPANIVTGNFKTKMEMSIYKVFRVISSLR